MNVSYLPPTARSGTAAPQPRSFAGAAAEILSTRPDVVLLATLGALLAFRLWLSVALPFTADEAYYVDTGRHPDWGLYDHPAMISRWLAVQLRISDIEWWLRLPSTLLPLLLAIAVRWLLPLAWPDIGRQRASWAAMLVALEPVNVWNVLITTDTPLIFFSVLSGLAWLIAGRRGNLAWYLACGLLLAGALLSKYFAFLLGFAYLVDAVLRRNRHAWLGLAIVFACTLPALALMAWWNAGHCWVNVMFNFFTRTQDARLSWKPPLLYAVTLAYALTPPVLWHLARHGRVLMAPDTRSAALLALAPLGFYAAVAFGKVVGLHWVLAFVVFALVAVAYRLPIEPLRRTMAFFAVFALLHAAVLLGALRLPVDSWRWSHHYGSIVISADPAPFLDKLKPYQDDYVFASDDYAISSTLGYWSQRAGGKRFIVVGEGSYHGRQDDIDTDFRTLDGRNILILTKTASAAENYRGYFEDTQVIPFAWRDARYWIILGRGFRYAPYRDKILTDIKRRWYGIPTWLPQTGCFFCDRYFPTSRCAN